MNDARSQLRADIEGCRDAHARLLTTITGLEPGAEALPCRLPGWTIGHLLTHLARNADSIVRRLDGARRGDVLDQYVGGGEGRAAEIDAGAARSMRELVDDVHRSNDEVELAFAGVPDDVWDRPVRGVDGSQRPARTLPFGRWREVDVHHVDLGAGYSPADWPEGFVRGFLPTVLDGLADRTDRRALLAWTLGRGAPPDLQPWG